MKSFKVLFWTALFISAIHAGYGFGMPYYRYYSLKSDAAEVVRFELNGPEDVKQKIMEKVKLLNVPAGPEAVTVTERDGKFRAEASWTEPVVLFYGKYQKVLEFSFTAEE